MSKFRAMGRMSAIAAATMMIATSAAPAFAGTDPTTAPARVQDGDKRICVSEAVTGSRVPRKVCKTRERWIKEDGYDPSQGAR